MSTFFSSDRCRSKRALSSACPGLVWLGALVGASACGDANEEADDDDDASASSTADDDDDGDGDDDDNNDGDDDDDDDDDDDVTSDASSGDDDDDSETTSDVDSTSETSSDGSSTTDDSQSTTDDDTTTEGPVDCDKAPPPPEYECDATDVEGRLRCVPGVTVTGYQSRADGAAVYQLEVEQEVLHGDPSQGKFQQRVELAHQDEEAPLILKASGYYLSGASHELANIFTANVLSYEHRFFTPSVPSGDVPWQHLLIEEAATDAHRLWESFKWIYKGPWVSTGASKGGETSVFNRRFYPCDLEATVAYVAPLVLGVGDARFDTFLQNVGDTTWEDCRQRLIDTQIALLEQRDDLVAMMDAGQYSILGAEVAFEHAVIEFPFGFWQYGSPSTCNDAPGKGASTSALWSYITAQGLDNFTDSSIEHYRPYFYQAGRELGSPGGNLEHLLDLLKHEDTYNIQSYLPGIDFTLDPKAMPKIQDWVSKYGERLMFIYGSFDPWTAGAYELGDAKDSFLYTVEGGNHGSTIGGLSAADREDAIANLERWLGVVARNRHPRDLPDIVRDRPRL